MNETQPSTPCICTTCPGASCDCGCQNVPSRVAAEAAPQAAPLAACACGARCQCGANCACAPA